MRIPTTLPPTPPPAPPTPSPPPRMCLHNLDGVAVEEGGSLGDFPGASLDECRTHCETNPSC
jgi:hypothetical protein